MPILVQKDLPAKQILESENILVMDEERASTQDIRPLQICILNLMPLKEATELDILRVLSNFPIQVQITFMMIESHESTHTTSSHLNKFYTVWSEIKEQYFDGLIITGAPVETMEFEEVEYWEELQSIMNWSRTHVFSTFHVCWGAQAGLYHHHGIKKHMLDKKISGVYREEVLHHSKMMMRGIDDYFWCPQSRYTGIDEDAVAKNPELYVVAAAERTGSCVILAYQSRQIFVTGHTEYDRMTLDHEYHRDLAKGLNPEIPENYYPDDDPNKRPILSWRTSSNCLYTNWLNFIYQETPYVLGEFPPLEESSYTICDMAEA
ncbi:MAG: homoserine O-succinyltransferase [Lachnospiraceae bacterium]|nr:homoserine O-succinyltransferase [Lachnospiraceae bacterium]